MKVLDDLIGRIHNNKKDIFYDSVKNGTQHFIKDLYEFFFLPQQNEGLDQLKENFELLYDMLFVLINETTDDLELTEVHTEFFVSALPKLYGQLMLDAGSILEFDSQIKDFDEVYFLYPGFFAVYAYRISHQLWKQEVKTLPYLISQYAGRATGIDIHPACIIGDSFFINHGTRIAIGRETIIGNNVKIYPGSAPRVSNIYCESESHIMSLNIAHNTIVYSGSLIWEGM